MFFQVFSQTKADFLAYVKRHELSGLFSELLARCFLNNVDEPKQYIVEYLTRTMEKCERTREEFRQFFDQNYQKDEAQVASAARQRSIFSTNKFLGQEHESIAIPKISSKLSSAQNNGRSIDEDEQTTDGVLEFQGQTGEQDENDVNRSSPPWLKQEALSEEKRSQIRPIGEGSSAEFPPAFTVTPSSKKMPLRRALNFEEESFSPEASEESPKKEQIVIESCKNVPADSQFKVPSSKLLDNTKGQWTMGKFTGIYLKKPLSLYIPMAGSKTSASISNVEARIKQPRLIVLPCKRSATQISDENGEESSSALVNEPTESTGNFEIRFQAVYKDFIERTKTNQTQDGSSSREPKFELQDGPGLKDELPSTNKAEAVKTQTDDDSAVMKKPRLMVFPSRRATLASLDEVGANSSSEYEHCGPTMRPQRHTMTIRQQPNAAIQKNTRSQHEVRHVIVTRSHKNFEHENSSLTAKAKSSRAPSQLTKPPSKEYAGTAKVLPGNVVNDSGSDSEMYSAGSLKVRLRTTTVSKEMTDYISNVVLHPAKSGAATATGMSSKLRAEKLWKVN